MTSTELELRSRVEALESKLQLRGEYFSDPELGPGAPAIEDLRVLAEFQDAITKTVILTWTVPDDPFIDTFEIWVKDITNEASGYVKIVDCKEPPATLVLTSDATTAKVLTVRTRMRDRTGTILSSSPSVAVNVEVSDVALDRFAWVNPTSGDGYNVIPIHTFTSGNGDTVEVVNHTGAGRFISFGVAMYDVGATSGACNLWVDITIDGGTTQSYQVIFASRVFGDTILPWATTGSAPHGDFEGDAILVPVNVTYETSLVVEFRVAVTSNFGGGDFDAVCVVHRATLS